MSLSIRSKMLPLKSLGFATIGAGYMGIGTALQHPAREILVQNLTDVTLVFSDDGVTDKFKLPKYSGYVVDISANRASPTDQFDMSKGDRLYVKLDPVSGASPSLGEVCFSAIYADQE